MWFRRDLRVRDNTALHEAANAATRGVVATFVLCPEQWRKHDDAPAKVEFWLRNLQELKSALSRLNIPLVVVQAPRASSVPALLVSLAERTKCDALYFNCEYEFDERQRDDSVAEAFRARGLAIHSRHDHVLFEPGSIRTQADRPYSVFTPFKRNALRRVAEQDLAVLPVPPKQAEIEVASTSVPIAIDGFKSPVDPSQWPAGEDAALKQLRLFCGSGIDEYAHARDFPALDGTSRLSPYLSAGILSPRQCLAAAVRLRRSTSVSKPGAGASTWVDELLWREFYHHVVALFPRVSMGRAFRPETDRIRWRDDPECFERWTQGQTGVPIVDAAMRQPSTVGWMHNRLRMISAMYLSKDLFIDWRLGEQHFMRHLVDGDLAANNGGWQWCASTGCDAAPYFRVFNPVTQSERFDRQGEFLRAWLPELAHVQGKAIHDPGRLAANVRKHLSYPMPMVDRTATKQRVMAAFRSVSGHARSNIVASPWPTPTQSDATPRLASRRSISCTSVAASRAPLAPSGWPIAIAPPFTFTRASSNFSSRMHATACAANASLISKRSIASTPTPARAMSLLMAGTGPIPICAGSTPADALGPTKASARRPKD